MAKVRNLVAGGEKKTDKGGLKNFQRHWFLIVSDSLLISFVIGLWKIFKIGGDMLSDVSKKFYGDCLKINVFE